MKLGICENEKCRNFRKLHKSNHTGRFVCVRCHEKDPFYHKQCSGCKKLRKPVLRTIKRLYPIRCPACGRRNPKDAHSSREDKSCHWCGFKKPVEQEFKERFCSECAKNHEYRKEKCSSCTNKRQVHKRLAEGPICRSCYNDQHKGMCQCGKIERIVAEKNGKPLGHNCWQREWRKQKKLLSQKPP